jgi:hypothetical protein
MGGSYSDEVDAELRTRLREAFRWINLGRKHDRLLSDHSGWWRDPWLLRSLGPALAAPFEDSAVTVVIGPESRGFLPGPLTAAALSWLSRFPATGWSTYVDHGAQPDDTQNRTHAGSAVVAAATQYATFLAVGQLGQVGRRDVVQRQIQVLGEHRHVPDHVTEFLCDVGPVDPGLVAVEVSDPLLELLRDLTGLADQPKHQMEQLVLLVARSGSTRAPR